MSNGAYPPKWASLPVPPHNSTPMDPQLAMQQNMYKNNKDTSHLKPNPPDYYQYPQLRPAYPGYITHPHTPYDMANYPMGPQLMQRRPNPEWNHWPTDMGNMMEHVLCRNRTGPLMGSHHRGCPYPGMQRGPSPICTPCCHLSPTTPCSPIRSIQGARDQLGPFSPNTDTSSSPRPIRDGADPYTLSTGNMMEHVPMQEQNWAPEGTQHPLYPQMYNTMYRGTPYPGSWPCSPGRGTELWVLVVVRWVRFEV